MDPIHRRRWIERVVVARPCHFEPVRKAIIVDVSGLGGSEMGELIKGSALRSGGVSDRYRAGIASDNGYGTTVADFRQIMGPAKNVVTAGVRG